MNNIIALKDFKGRFGSKHFDTPYRSGLDKSLLTEIFASRNYKIEFKPFYEAINLTDKTVPILYSSSEDINYYYKSYIEDVILNMEISGFKVLPAYIYLRANNNKVFMESLRKSKLPAQFNNFWSMGFGSFEDFTQYMATTELTCPIVIKTAEGASGSGVFKADTNEELTRIIKKISRTKALAYEIHDWLRAKKHSGYKRESVYRKKFIIQEFIPNLKNDWKVYVFGSKYYIFKRPIFKHRGFRASGGGYDNYFYGEQAEAPEGLFDFAETFFRSLNIPHASLDIAFDGKQFYLLEFQLLYFGTAGIPYSEGFFKKADKIWEFEKSKLCIEEVYVDSIVEFLKRV